MATADLTIHLDIPGLRAHLCHGMCDCPTAIARAQQAIDTDRSVQGTAPRPLGVRIYEMRHAAPSTAWFEAIAVEAERLETRVRNAPSAGAQSAEWAASCDAADAGSLADRINALQLLIEDTVKILERADLIPLDHEYVHDVNLRESRVYAGNLRFRAGITGSPDRDRYIVTTQDDDVDDVPPTERFTTDLNEVHAWLLHWGASAVYQERHRSA